MKINWNLVTEQQMNGCYAMNEAGLAIAEQVKEGTELKLMDNSIHIVRESYFNAPNVFYFKTVNSGSHQSYGIEQIKKIIK